MDYKPYFPSTIKNTKIYLYFLVQIFDTKKQFVYLFIYLIFYIVQTIDFQIEMLCFFL